MFLVNRRGSGLPSSFSLFMSFLFALLCWVNDLVHWVSSIFIHCKMMPSIKGFGIYQWLVQSDIQVRREKVSPSYYSF